MRWCPLKGERERKKLVTVAVHLLVHNDEELRAQLETMSDADDDEWLHDERTTHVEENHEEPGEA